MFESDLSRAERWRNGSGDFLHCIENGPEVCNSFDFGTEEDKKELNLVLKKFEDYRSPRKNTSFERIRFWNRSQQRW